MVIIAGMDKITTNSWLLFVKVQAGLKKISKGSRNSSLYIMKDVVFLFHTGLATVAFSTTSQKEDAKHMRLQLKVTWIFWLAQDVST